MAKRTVPDNRKNRLLRDLSQSAKRQRSSILPSGFKFVSRDDGLYIRSLETGNEIKVLE